jgi:CrcB protein
VVERVNVRPRPRRALLSADVLLVIFVGGCAGGAARYGLTKAAPDSPYGFPWTIFAINTAGALLLAVIVVIAAELAPPRHLRPLVGTGFCGAFTTFSSIVLASDELFAHGHAGVAIAYLVASIAAGLAAAWGGLSLTTRVVRHLADPERDTR